MERNKRKQKLDEVLGLADLGAIDEKEFDRRWDAAGGITVNGGSVENAPDEHLIAFFNARTATEGQKAYFASLIVGRGLATCGCKDCRKVHAYAKRWSDFIARGKR
jgi:hypothetical protein